MATIKLKWLPEAVADVERLYFFLVEKDVESAKRAIQCIQKGAQLLIDSPKIGRLMSDDSGRRELFMIFGAGAYVLRYKLEDESTVVIIRCWHSRERRS